MGRIRRLPDDLANQIAAGEVVERPASVVKELVENAVDAGATRVTVELEQGGVARVRVSDDGEGMPADDAVLSLERHATSKLRGPDDLFTLRTFGFRGEALPSIASVSRLRLVSRPRGALEGTEVRVDGGGAPKVSPVGAPEGTSVDVGDLFFNVPARRKFLKSTGTEAAHVGEVLLFAALARPDVSFFLIRDGRPAREWLRVAARRERAAQALEGEQLEPCVAERGLLRIEGHLAAPERARAGAVALHLVVNGRPIRDRALARAVAQAYGSVLEPGRYPIGVVYIDLPGEQVDVNVHPQKTEVRFADGRGLFGVVTRELHAMLARAFAVPALGGPRAWNRPQANSTQALAEWAPSNRSDHAGLGWGGRVGDVAAAPSQDDPQSSSREDANATSREDANTPSREDPQASSREDAKARLGAGTPLASFDEVARSGRNYPLALADPTLFAAPTFYASLEYLGQVRATYLVCAGADGLYILDQHAAAERVTFDRLRRAFATRAIPMQRLLVPELATLLPSELATLEVNADVVASFGLEVRAVGSTTVAVHAVPAMLSRARPERLLRDLLAELSHAAKRPFGDASDLVLATMACHGSVRAGDALTREEATALLAELDAIDFAGHCPHGRPIITRLAFEELERRVGR